MIADARHGRLEARPGVVASAGPAGLHRLAFGTGRDAYLYAPREPRVPVPLCVVLHGAGGEPLGAIDLLQAAADESGVLLLAPASAGRTWDLIDGAFGPDVAAIDASLERAFLDHPVGAVAVAGFSDGASYALSLGLTNGDLFSDALAFSPGFVQVRRPHGRPRVYVSHGRADDVLPVAACGRRVARELEAAGYDVEYEEFDGGHVVPSAAASAALWRFVDGRHPIDPGNAARPDAHTPGA